jgi:ERCC4-related helicase
MRQSTQDRVELLLGDRATIKTKHVYGYVEKTAAEGPEEYPVPDTFYDWFKPYRHQGVAVKKLLRNDGKVILAHKPGMGKTATSIYGFETLKTEGKATRALVVVPAGLRENFAKEGITKFLKIPSWQIVASSSERGRKGYVRPEALKSDKDYTVVSYAMFRKDPVGLMERVGADTLIMDEVHKARNETSGVFPAAILAREKATNFIGLTASLVNNDPAEVASLLTISEGKRMLTPKQFRRMHTEVKGYERGFKGSKKEVRRLKDKPRMLRNIEPRVDYASPDMIKGGKTMPRRDLQFVDVPMSREQWGLYQLAMKDLGPLKALIMRRDSDVTVKDAKNLFAQTAQARQISNSVHTGKKITAAESSQVSPKVKQLLDDAEVHIGQKPDNKIVLYSNLIRGGVDVISAGLTSRKIPHEIFVGKGTEVGDRRITSEVRDSGIENFKQGKVKVLVLSGAGAEGLSLNNATGFFALDGHFNPERILQAEARVRRLGGQSHRPEPERQVDIRRYRSTAPKDQPKTLLEKIRGVKAPEQTVDEWMYSTAGRKHVQNKEFYDAVKSAQTASSMHKYVRRWRGKDGDWQYEYPRRQSIFTKVKNALIGPDDYEMPSEVPGVPGRKQGIFSRVRESFLGPPKSVAQIQKTPSIPTIPKPKMEGVQHDLPKRQASGFFKQLKQYFWPSIPKAPAKLSIPSAAKGGDAA